MSDLPKRAGDPHANGLGRYGTNWLPFPGNHGSHAGFGCSEDPGGAFFAPAFSGRGWERVDAKVTTGWLETVMTLGKREADRWWRVAAWVPIAGQLVPNEIEPDRELCSGAGGEKATLRARSGGGCHRSFEVD